MPANTVQHTLRQFLAAIHRNLPGLVLQRRIAEAFDQAVGVGAEIHAGNTQSGRLFIKHQPAGCGFKILVSHTVGNVLISRQIAQPGQEGVAAVKHAQFHLLPGQNVVNHLDTDRFPLGTARNKMIFDYPLNKRLSADGARIVHAEKGADFL